MLLGKNYDNALLFSKVIRRNIVVCFSATVRDNVVSYDVMITSSLRRDVIILSINFLCS